MPYSNECPLCGANLDPCEKCDCTKRKEEKANETKGIKKKVNTAAS